jgi:phage-related minor tail protein
MAQSMEGALDRFVQTGKISFSELTRSIIADLLKMQLKAQATGIFKQLFSSLGLSFGGADFAPSATSTGIIGMYADGGDPPVGVPSIVGERGAELFVPRTAGTIIPNHALSSMMVSQPQTVYNGTVIQNMSAIDTQSGVQFLAKNKNAVFAANQSAQRSLPQGR